MTDSSKLLSTEPNRLKAAVNFINPPLLGIIMPKKAKTSVENAVKTSDKTAEDPTGTAAKEAQKQEKSAAHSSAKDNHAPKKEKAAAKSEKSPKRSEKHTDKESGAAGRVKCATRIIPGTL